MVLNIALMHTLYCSCGVVGNHARFSAWRCGFKSHREYSAIKKFFILSNSIMIIEGEAIMVRSQATMKDMLMQSRMTQYNAAIAMAMDMNRELNNILNTLNASYDLQTAIKRSSFNDRDFRQHVRFAADEGAKMLKALIDERDLEKREIEQTGRLRPKAQKGILKNAVNMAIGSRRRYRE